MSEATLIEQCQSGCQESLDLLYREYRPVVLKITRRFMGNEQDAEDAAQEVFIRVFARINQFRRDAPFSVWIRTLTANLCTDILRREKRRYTESLDQLYSAGEGWVCERVLSVSQEEELIMKELLENLEEKISHLKEEHQKLIILRYIDGLSYRKMAQLLGYSEGLVKCRLHQARKNLRRICHDFKTHF